MVEKYIPVGDLSNSFEDLHSALGSVEAFWFIAGGLLLLMKA